MKSHFVFSKSERNGIFLLVTIILVLQLAYWLIPFPKGVAPKDTPELVRFQQKVDSLKQLKIKENTPKQYPFNPNFLTDYKGYTLGMSTQEIDRLLAYRKQNKWVNSKKDFQDVTKVSDSLLNTFSHLFKFPDFITNPKKKKVFAKDRKLSYKDKIDLNKATALQLQEVYGIGPYYSEKIIAYRTKLNGFSDNVQLNDVYGLEPNVINNILKKFTVKTPVNIKKININTAKITDLSELPNLNYEIARQIIKYRELNGEFNDINQLKSIAEFPIEKFDRIQLYLTL
ncbi:ComEA family DNA-binding protein [Croceibacter atlanticus]|jgi:competence protein ComEA|uniref:ComEA family DNA-binding protein n=1 Tax=Croceibacter atlanticus TaxID=313588 RepID=UPI00032484A0|nr:helix-hairpin-helix domain-containing protein [Croceibacter atlanticus]MBW4971404.1 helix-hairpin-helix domain-containing protein [Croceibacter atlanticus]